MENFFELLELLLGIIVWIAIVAVIIFIPLLLLTIIIKIIKSMYDNSQNPEKPKPQKGKYPIWEKQSNPDGTYTYKVVGYSKHEQTTKYQPYQRANILTPTEYDFWEKLYLRCSMENIIVCPKVRMEDIINVDKNHKDREVLRNKIKSRHIDFILCDSHLKVLAGLELDDRSHQSLKAQKADTFKNEVFDSLDIPLYRIKVEPNNYSAEISRVISGLKNMNGIQDNFKPNYSAGHKNLKV